MSQENVDVSRRFWAVFNSREWDVWSSLLDDDIEWHARVDEPDADVYRGQARLRSLRDMWIEMFPDLRLELAGDSIDLGDQVITPTQFVGTARASGIVVREPYSWLFGIAKHKIFLVR